MDPKFLKYYNDELTYMRQLSGEFAAQHPKIARRLGMQGIEVADPYVERLIESFCFMSARVQLKLDAEFPRFTQRMLEVVHPNYVAPTPSMAVAHLKPSLREGDFTKGLTIARHSMLRSAVPPGEQTACEFRSAHDVTLWPVEIIEAKLSTLPPDLPNLDRYRLRGLRGALRLRLRTVGEIKFSQIHGLDRLPIYLAGDERVASHLFELLHAGGLASVVRAPGAARENCHVVANKAIEFEGLRPEQSLLPVFWNSFHGHTLLQEYFACRQRFYFFTPTQLAPGLSRVDGKEAEILLLLDRLPEELSSLVDASRFLLYCTPIINLFPKRTDRIEIDRAQTAFHLAPDRSRPLDYEVYSVTRVSGQKAETSNEVIFNPLYQTVHSDIGNYGRYFSMLREPRKLSDSARKYGTRTPYLGTEVFISLVDQHEAPYADDMRYLSVDTLVTNRDLPRLIPRNGQSDLTMQESVPIDSVVLVHAPSAPREPYASSQAAWRLIRQLSFNYIPLSDMDHQEGGQALRNMLRLFIGPGDREQATQIEGLVGSRIERIIRRLPGNELLVYGRGVRCELTVDENNFSGLSPYLFGLVLEHYLARHVAINVFTETELRSMQRGEVARWKPRMGGRGAI